MAKEAFHYADLIGQEALVARLKAFTEFFAATGGVPGHVLLVGEDGMGQSTIAMTFANEREVGFQEVDATSFEKVGDLTALITNVRQSQILVLSNLQRLRAIHVDKLRQVMREGKLEISLGQGPAIRMHTMDIKDFTLVATCPKKSDCPAELLDEFSLVLTLQPYSKGELQLIAENIAKSGGVSVDQNAVELIARSCDGRPGHLASIWRRLSRAINKNDIAEQDMLQVFAAFGIPVRPDVSPSGFKNISDLSGRDFEALITTLLIQMGFQAEMTRATGDGGIDIIAALDKPIVGGRYLFQCKRFASDSLVGAPTVRDFYGAVTADRAVKGIFITTSDFTLQAQEFGQKVGVELINLKRLENLLLEYGLASSLAE